MQAPVDVSRDLFALGVFLIEQSGGYGVHTTSGVSHRPPRCRVDRCGVDRNLPVAVSGGLGGGQRGLSRAGRGCLER